MSPRRCGMCCTVLWEWHDVGTTVGVRFVATFYDCPIFVFNFVNIHFIKGISVHTIMAFREMLMLCDYVLKFVRILFVSPNKRDQQIIEQSSSWEGSICIARYSTFCILWKLRVHYCFPKSIPLDPVSAQVNPLHIVMKGHITYWTKCGFLDVTSCFMPCLYNIKYKM